MQVEDVDIHAIKNRSSIRLVLKGGRRLPASRDANLPRRRQITIHNEEETDRTKAEISGALGLEVGALFFPVRTPLEVEELHFCVVVRPKYLFKPDSARKFENTKAAAYHMEKALNVRAKMDLENLEKVLFDTSEGIIFDDDKYIVATGNLWKSTIMRKSKMTVKAKYRKGHHFDTCL
jgi:hypothetical protein